MASREANIWSQINLCFIIKCGCLKGNMVIVLDGAYHSVIKSIAFEAVKIRCSKQCFSQKVGVLQ